MDRLEEMRTFIAISENGVTGAAERLRIAPSAVSRRLKDLETRLGVDLMTRTTRRMNLTDAGREFLSDCSRIMEEVAAAEARARDGDMAPAGAIRIAAPLSFGLSHLQPVLNDFMFSHPLIQIESDLDDRIVDIQRERYDLAIRISKLRDSSLQARKLGNFRLLLVASKSFLKANGRPKTLSDLSGLPALCYTSAPRPDTLTCYDPKGRRGSVKVDMRLLSNSGDAMREAAIDGLGVTLLPEFIVGRAIAENKLVVLLDDHTWPTLDVFAVRPARQYLPQRVRMLIDFLVAQVSKRADGLRAPVKKVTAKAKA